jgi:hypothetical protein
MTVSSTLVSRGGAGWWCVRVQGRGEAGVGNGRLHTYRTRDGVREVVCLVWER